MSSSYVANPTNTNSDSLTYEQTSAFKSNQSSPDPIHYDTTKSYRDSPYRKLHHQNGTIGNYTVRLLEAKDLKRSHWSLLGLGPVKHLGLSKAHGEVSSFAEIQLGFRNRREDPLMYDDTDEDVNKNAFASSASISSSVASSSKTPSDDHHGHNVDTPTKSNLKTTPSSTIIFPPNHKIYQSTPIPSDSNPKWPTVQSESTNRSLFTVPLLKGSMPVDGMKVVVSVVMREERSAMDSFVPGLAHDGGGGGSDDDERWMREGTLGVGEVDVTELILRGYGSYGTEKQQQEYGVEMVDDKVDVWDIWVDLHCHDPNHNNENAASSGNCNSTAGSSISKKKAGKVRLLITYEPNGLNPKRGDIVALESFARRSRAAMKSTPIVPPLHPLKVLDVKGEYILAQYDIVHERPVHNDRNSSQRFHEGRRPNEAPRPKKRTGTVRLHRNTLFVIERTNLLDSTVNLALAPADIVMSTPIGREVTHAASPYVDKAKDLAMPAVLSGRLFFEAAKVGGSATLIGLKSGIAAVVESQDPERTRRARKNSFENY